MRNSPDSSPVYSTCRLDWRPSRPLAVALVILGALAAGSVLASAMPPLCACVVAGGAFGWALQLAGRELRAAPGALVLDGEGRGRWCGADGEISLHALRPVFRGPLVVIAGRAADGRRRRWLFWPGSLDAAERRRLRLLAGPAAGGDAPVPSVAA